jgi:predicted TIM-barrel fold metal-dependent hydrolase
MPVVDADTHVIESDRSWEYLSQEDQKFRPLPVTVEKPSIQASGALGGKTTAAADAQAAQGTFWFIDGRLAFRGGARADYAFATRDMSDIPGRLAAMDEFGVDIQVLYPSVMMSNLFRPQVELALTRSYNRWLADIYRESKGRLRWVVAPPLQQMDEALAEVEFGAKNGACGILFRSYELDRPADHPMFDPLYRKSAENNLPICVHSGIGGAVLRDALMVSSVFSAANLPSISMFHTILTSGLTKRHPELRWAIVETGSNWLPFVLDRTWQLTRRGDDRFTRPSTSLMEENRLFVTCESHEDLAYITSWTGDNTLIFGTDYGHNDTSTMVDGHNRMRTRTDVSQDVVRKIMADNACALYGIAA